MRTHFDGCLTDIRLTTANLHECQRICVAPARRTLACQVLLLLLSLLLLGCAANNQKVVDLSFADGKWTAGFAEYPVGEEAFFELESGLRPLPPPLDQSATGFFTSGNNHSDDLFMYLKHPLNGLKPNATYRVQFHLEFATDVPQGCLGIGGAPGESVFVKAGASVIEPDRVVTSFGTRPHYAMNIDKGIQANPGKDAIVLGNVANSQTNCSRFVYEIKTLESGPGSFAIQADQSGRFWLLVGTDSGYEGRTILYYTRLKVILLEL